jgi:hypothetical protein
MRGIGTSLLRSIQDRISHAMDANDLPAPPLAIGYAKFKTKRYPPAIRNLRMTGAMLGHLAVKDVAMNKVTIGFRDGVRTYYWTNKKTGIRERRARTILDIVRMNQRRSRQWGVSPSDQRALINSIRGKHYFTLAVRRSA